MLEKKKTRKNKKNFWVLEEHKRVVVAALAFFFDGDKPQHTRRRNLVGDRWGSNSGIPKFQDSSLLLPLGKRSNQTTHGVLLGVRFVYQNW